VVKLLNRANEKIPNPSSRHFNNRLFKLLLYFNLVNSSIEIFLKVKFRLKIIIVMIFWMSIVAGIIFGINTLINIPDEIIGPAFFLGIGMAISSTINYYK
jgi:hypothetical protein